MQVGSCQLLEIEYQNYCYTTMTNLKLFVFEFSINELSFCTLALLTSLCLLRRQLQAKVAKSNVFCDKNCSYEWKIDWIDDGGRIVLMGFNSNSEVKIKPL